MFLMSACDKCLSISSLQTLISVIQTGWPKSKSALPVEVQEYFSIRDELIVDEGIIFKGSRVVIPTSLRKEIIDRIHYAHLGIVGCLRRARLSVYWPNMTRQLTEYIGKCEICNRLRNQGQKSEPLIFHERPTLPWAKVGVDLFSMDNQSYIVAEDYWSNFIEFDVLHTTSTSAVIGRLKRYFATRGVPKEVVTDNGSQFVSAEFRDFGKKWLFKHTTVSPYHHRANG